MGDHKSAEAIENVDEVFDIGGGQTLDYRSADIFGVPETEPSREGLLSRERGVGSRVRREGRADL